ncbi:pyruvoyl-dependent arginine decarboxylase [Roseomonas sp. CECT 9278]|uniref:pyruvoyl-dependent arginine decarboxylase n=1 Tax=Roseomonas sp. CECT 9278 TaxID=2845823 RepID=UPI001EF9C640|nr:pyruvoyl-dependent arginine decarboxylase [Roseomonas sp. CECT 9278]CAH0127772.1 Pyruvoyl-dependent arginine decarboxylase [Roseomonas sp. CECT 9278]
MNSLPFGPIVIARGVGRGPTEMAAFDAALRDAGVADYNLLYLSSVIPPGSRIERRRWTTPPEHWGQRLYVVLSQMRGSQLGEIVHAGIGWVQHAQGGHGLFVELHGSDRERLDRELALTLGAMQQGRGIDFDRVNSEIASAVCEGQPVCALVVAVYAIQYW